jgi:ubiquitin C-terminal hydrolase
MRNEPPNSYDKNDILNNFFEDFKKKGISMVSDLFFGISETTTECLYCRMNYNSEGFNVPICYDYEIFNCLIFPLQEVSNMKNNSLQYNNYINMIQNNRVSIYECFNYSRKTRHFTGDNRKLCNFCNQLFDCDYTTRIYSSPNILIIILYRRKDNMYDIKIDFNEEIDIAQFILTRDKPQIIYNLYGVITQLGKNGPNNHFVASCKSPIDNKWYRCDDAFISPINDIQRDVIEFGTPHVLFYERKK